MKNMGLRRLKLVNPQRYQDGECRAMARGAVDLLDSAQVYASFDEALADENVVVGTTSGRGRGKKGGIQTPREIVPLLWQHASTQRIALVFGPERRGLSDEQLARCQYVVSIPSQLQSPVLNLAQSVVILAYELFTVQANNFHTVDQLAPDSEREAMFRQAEQVLVDIGFLSARKPGHIMGAIRRFLRRSPLTSRDIRIIRGMFSQVEWYVQEGHGLPEEKVTKS